MSPMQKFFRCLMLTGFVTGIATVATAGELTVQIADGRATVIAREVPLRQILDEWARVGNTRVVNGEKMSGGPVTLELVDLPEKQALDILLRSAAGYMAAPRPEHAAGASLYDRVIILATSRPPAASPVMPPQPFGGNRPFIQQTLPPQPRPDEDIGERDEGPMPGPGMVPPPGVPFPGGPEADPNELPQQPAPITSPRPGQLPQQPQPTPGVPVAPERRGNEPDRDDEP